MKIFVESSGGIGNIRIRGELELDELAPELKERAERVLAGAGRRRRAPPANPHAADMMSYQLSFVPADGMEPTERIALSDADGDAEVLDFARALLREIVRKAKTAGNGS